MSLVRFNKLVQLVGRMYQNVTGIIPGKIELIKERVFAIDEKVNKNWVTLSKLQPKVNRINGFATLSDDVIRVNTTLIRLNSDVQQYNMEQQSMQLLLSAYKESSRQNKNDINGNRDELKAEISALQKLIQRDASEMITVKSEVENLKSDRNGLVSSKNNRISTNGIISDQQLRTLQTDINRIRTLTTAVNIQVTETKQNYVRATTQIENLQETSKTRATEISKIKQNIASINTGGFFYNVVFLAKIRSFVVFFGLKKGDF